MVKNLPVMWEAWVQSLGWEDPLEKGMATHSSILLPGEFHGQRSLAATVQGVARSRHDWATNTHTRTHAHTQMSHGRPQCHCLQFSLWTNVSNQNKLLNRESVPGYPGLHISGNKLCQWHQIINWVMHDRKILTCFSESVGKESLKDWAGLVGGGQISAYPTVDLSLMVSLNI